MRPVVALVTGLTKCRALLERSFAPLRVLVQDGVIDRILYVTWDNPDIDRYVEPAAAYPEVEIARVPEPEISGTAVERGVAYQSRNLASALTRISADDTLVIKLRPDFVFDAAFLREKIAGFDACCAPSLLAELFGASAPPSPFCARIWLPWADANLPFHFEDAAFIGLKSDISRLADDTAAAIVRNLSLPEQGYGAIAHIARYAIPFLETWLPFAGFVNNYRYFYNETHYRTALMREAAGQPFFWRLVIANAWILATSFHVDCGAPGQLAFYPNGANKEADWSSLRRLKMLAPYNAVDAWRQVQRPGGVLPGAGRLFALLVDDSWQEALFTGNDSTDVPASVLRRELEAAAMHRAGDPGEFAFYAALEKCRRSLQSSAAAA